MELLELTFASPEENLACDEALLEAAESGVIGPVLRLWRPSSYFVVLGHASRLFEEVNVAACSELGIPVLRRCSGGGTVLQGPGCLNYSLILEIQPDGPTHSPSSTNAYIMEKHRQAIQNLLKSYGIKQAVVKTEGITDLTLNGQKFSGNAQRRRKRWLLFHGTFLTNFDLRVMESVLPLPRRQPAYRVNRAHSEFLVNLPLPAETIEQALIDTWAARSQLKTLPLSLIETLAREKYSNPDWTHKFV